MSRPLRVGVLVGGLVAVLLVGFGAGSVASEASGSDQVGTGVNSVTVHPIPTSVGKIAGQWNDGQVHLLPGSTVTLTVPGTQHDFFLVSYEGVSGISCISTAGQFVGALPVLENSMGAVIPFFTGTNNPVTPVLGGGTYTLGLSAVCAPPDSVNDPSASFQVGGDIVITRVK